MLPCVPAQLLYSLSSIVPTEMCTSYTYSKVSYPHLLETVNLPKIRNFVGPVIKLQALLYVTFINIQKICWSDTFLVQNWLAQDRVEHTAYCAGS